MKLKIQDKKQKLKDASSDGLNKKNDLFIKNKNQDNDELLDDGEMIQINDKSNNYKDNNIGNNNKNLELKNKLNDQYSKNKGVSKDINIENNSLKRKRIPTGNPENNLNNNFKDKKNDRN